LELATLIASFVTAAAVAGSVLFLARQTSQSVEQFLVANELAGARALAQGYELWDHVITRFIDYQSFASTSTKVWSRLKNRQPGRAFSR